MESTMKVRMTVVAVLLWAAVNLMAFGGMKFVKTWKNPDAQPSNWQGKKVAIFAGTLLIANQEPAQKALARELTQRGIQAVIGDTLVPTAAQKDRNAAIRILADAGITGAVVMRLVDYQSETEVTGEQYLGANYSSFSSYYNYGMSTIYVPGTADIKTTVMVECLVYSIEQDKLLWASTSKVVNPKEVDAVIKKLVASVGSEIRKSGLVKK
jgi:hypothetical protein